MSEFISPKEAADMLGVSTNTLRNWELSGKLMSMKTMGGHRRYYLKDIENYLKSINKFVIKEIK
ncbi:MAG: helix-turn-helix domain-containing protein [Proteobacteria bacterium]|jgi:excisionase family DNA binding protein|nr:helix-turn-helix domain-containing protein [Pseudomonadota bacterium]